MTAHTSLPHAPPTEVGLCPERTQRLMDVLRREVASGRLPGAVASVAFLLVPAFGVFVSTLWLGEPFGWDMVVGGALIVGSVVLAAAE